MIDYDRGRHGIVLCPARYPISGEVVHLSNSNTYEQRKHTPPNTDDTSYGPRSLHSFLPSCPIPTHDLIRDHASLRQIARRDMFAVPYPVSRSCIHGQTEEGVQNGGESFVQRGVMRLRSVWNG
jgi:hypothetical protein